MPLKELVEKRNELAAKQKELDKVFKEGGQSDGTLDLSKVKAIEGTSVEKSEKIRAMNEELNKLNDEVEALAAVEKAQQDQKLRDRLITQDEGISHPGEKKDQKAVRRHLGGHLVEAKKFQDWLKHKVGVMDISVGCYPTDLKAHEIKTLFETSAGWAPESTRTGILAEYATRPIEITDLFPTARTQQAAVVYMEETTYTQNAAETAEGAAYPESAFALTQRSQTVRKIAHSIPVTDEQLDDVPQVDSYLTSRLTFGLRQRLDYQLLNGDNSAPNLYGILNHASIQTQAKGSDPVPDAIFKAMILVQHTGRATPNAVILHPNDWQSIRLTRTSDGIYIWGNPSEAVAPRIWGLPIAVSSCITENTGLVGDFANHVVLFERSGIDIQVGYVNTQFTEGERTMRASFRVCLVILRGAAFCTVTSI